MRNITREEIPDYMREDKTVFVYLIDEIDKTRRFAEAWITSVRSEQNHLKDLIEVEVIEHGSHAAIDYYWLPLRRIYVKD